MGGQRQFVLASIGPGVLRRFVVMDVSRVQQGSAWEIVRLVRREALDRTIFIAHEGDSDNAMDAIKKYLPERRAKPELLLLRESGDFVNPAAFEAAGLMRTARIARYAGLACVAGMALTVWLAPAGAAASFFLLLALLVGFLVCVAIVVFDSARNRAPVPMPNAGAVSNTATKPWRLALALAGGAAVAIAYFAVEAWPAWQPVAAVGAILAIVLVPAAGLPFYFFLSRHGRLSIYAAVVCGGVLTTLPYVLFTLASWPTAGIEFAQIGETVRILNGRFTREGLLAYFVWQPLWFFAGGALGGAVTWIIGFGLRTRP